jgi:cell wall-associated NlpC family hydrolase
LFKLPTRWRRFFLLIFILTSSAASAEPDTQAEIAERQAVTGAAFVARQARNVAQRAYTFIGVPYRFGGSQPATGFDCSGFVHYLYQTVIGDDLPRHSKELGSQGQAIKVDQLEPGDLVFFKMNGQAFSHVGIYVGEGQFIHAPGSGERIQVQDIDNPFWMSRLSGARRYLTQG